MANPPSRGFYEKFSPLKRNNHLPSYLAIKEPHKWNREEIFGFLSEIVRNPAEHGVQLRALRQLKDILEDLRKISLPAKITLPKSRTLATGVQSIYQGADDFQPTYYSGKNTQIVDDKCEPSQHIPRTRNPAWVETEWKTSRKFLLCPYNHFTFEFLTPYDLLGLFLSRTGPPPSSANKENFFQPMTFLYARWCSMIASGSAEPEIEVMRGAGAPPSAYQCTWIDPPRVQQPQFFLGASLSGFTTKYPAKEYDNKKVGREWANSIKRHRYKLLLKEILGKDYPEFENSPKISLDGPMGNHFGNCAETYPFIFVLGPRDQHPSAGGKEKPPRFHGLSMLNPVPKEYDVKKLILVGPCLNCKYLIESYVGKDEIPNFKP